MTYIWVFYSIKTISVLKHSNGIKLKSGRTKLHLKTISFLRQATKKATQKNVVIC